MKINNIILLTTIMLSAVQASDFKEEFKEEEECNNCANELAITKYKKTDQKLLNVIFFYLVRAVERQEGKWFNDDQKHIFYFTFKSYEDDEKMRIIKHYNVSKIASEDVDKYGLLQTWEPWL